MVQLNLLDELCEAFGVKKNPIVTFWFFRETFIEDKTADFPKDFEMYSLYSKKKFWMDDNIWCCYAKKNIPGCYSRDYWQR